MRKILKSLVLTFLLLVLLACGLGYFFLNTTTGFSTLISLTGHYLPGTLKTGIVQGRLLDSFVVNELSYSTDDLTVQAKQVHARLQISLSPHWQLNLQDLSTRDVKLHNKDTNISINPLQITGLWNKQGLEANVSSQIVVNAIEPWQLTAALKGAFPWNWHFKINLAPLAVTAKHRILQTKMAVEGTIQDKQNGTMIVNLDPGYYQLPENNLLPKLNFKGGVFNVLLSPEALKGSGSVAIDEHKKLNLLFKLPHFDLDKGLVDSQPLTAQLNLLVDSFDFLQSISPDISKIKGQLNASVNARGSVAKPVIESNINLNNARLDIAQLGLQLSSINLNVFANKSGWKTEGSLLSGAKKLALSGNGALTSPYNGNFVLQGKDLPIVNTKEYQINVSPQLNIKLTDSSVTINGTIEVPYAQIKPHNFSNSVTLSDDVVFQSQQSPPSSSSSSNAFKTNMDVRVIMGDKVTLAFKGLNALLTGTIDVKQIAPGPISATGELNVKKGTYKAYAQDLTIEQGQLLFTGGRVDNPGITVRASKKIDTSTATTDGKAFDLNNINLQNVNVRGFIEVGVEVSGRISQPKITLFANPSILSQADILSMMVLGRPASQANKAGGQLLLAAVSSMNLGNGTNGTQLLEQLKKNTGLDVNVQTNNNYNALTNQSSDSTSVVVGKSLSKRIYLSYNVGLSQTDPNVLMLKYLINKFYSIQVSSSTNSNAIDFLYTSSASDKKG